MTSTDKTRDAVADVFASLDAMGDQGGVHAEGPAKPMTIEQYDASVRTDPGQHPAPMAAPGLAAPAASAAAGRLAREALAGITNGAPRVERHRPARGKQRQLAVPVNSVGRLAEALGELTAGRSRRYAQDVEGWARAAVADHAGRGVLVVWDGANYTMKLSQYVPRNTVLECRQSDVRSWITRVQVT